MKYRSLLRLDGAAFSVPLAIFSVGCVVPLSTGQQTGEGDSGAATTSPDGGSFSGGSSGGGSSGSGSSSGGSSADGGSSSGEILPPDGAPVTGSWMNVTSNLANMDSECGNMTYVAAKPDEDLMIAGVATQGLWGSRNGGATWTLLGTGAGSSKMNHRPYDIVFDPAHSAQWFESGIYGTLNGVYKTTDDGTTFNALGTVQFNDGVSVDFTDPNRQTLLAGAHETPQSLFLTKNGGMTWANIGAGMPAGKECPEPYVVDGSTFLVGCSQNAGGIYRSTDTGVTWTSVSPSGGSFAPLLASDKSLYWASPDGTLVRSTDNGKTWTVQIAGGMLTWDRPTELPDGRLATIAGNYVVVSSDQGVTWRDVSPALPMEDGYSWFGIAYSQQQKAFFTWHWTCGNGSVPVPTDGIMRFDFDWNTQ